MAQLYEKKSIGSEKLLIREHDFLRNVEVDVIDCVSDRYYGSIATAEAEQSVCVGEIIAEGRECQRTRVNREN